MSTSTTNRPRGTFGEAPVDAPRAPDGFQEAIIAALPRLRAHALGLARNRADAEDLVQGAVANALAARRRFEPGTDFAAWSNRILRNRVISGVRQRRRRAELGGGVAPPWVAAAIGPPHEDRIALRELGGLLGRLPARSREALLLVSVQGLAYEEVAAAQGCTVGTAKSRVFRARQRLRAWLLGGPEASDGEDATRRAAAAAEPLDRGVRPARTPKRRRRAECGATPRTAPS